MSLSIDLCISCLEIALNPLAPPPPPTSPPLLELDFLTSDTGKI